MTPPTPFKTRLKPAAAASAPRGRAAVHLMLALGLAAVLVAAGLLIWSGSTQPPTPDAPISDYVAWAIDDAGLRAANAEQGFAFIEKLVARAEQSPEQSQALADALLALSPPQRELFARRVLIAGKNLILETAAQYEGLPENARRRLVNQFYTRLETLQHGLARIGDALEDSPAQAALPQEAALVRFVLDNTTTRERELALKLVRALQAERELRGLLGVTTTTPAAATAPAPPATP